MITYVKCEIADGTCYQGEILATYDELVFVFGIPSFIKRFDKKVTCEWTGTLDGVVFTIYDWKTKIPYMHNTIWNIGGMEKEAKEKVYEYFISIIPD